MSRNPAVSVVLPVFNAGAPLRRAVQSILNQDFPDFELILLDDASSDGSSAIAEDFANRDSRVRFVRHAHNHGLARTLNEGLSLARAPLIARMDQDDESLPHRLRVQIAFLDGHPDIAVAGSYIYHMGARPRFDHLIDLPTSAEEVSDTLRSRNCLYHPAVIFRGATVEAAGGYREDFVNAEDYELWLRVNRNHAICNIPEALLRYRFSTGGMTLGRKWQQLYFVYLAQATHGNDVLLRPAARARADQMLLETDRRQFFGDVAQGTVAEFLRLRLWRGAARVIVSFENELDPEVSADLARQLLRAVAAPAPAALAY